MSQATLATISPKELEDLKKSGKTFDLIDVRTPVEFREVHAEGARNVPLDRFEPGKILQERNALYRQVGPFT